MNIILITRNKFLRTGMDALIRKVRLKIDEDCLLLDSGSNGISFMKLYHGEIPLCLYHKIGLFSRLLICHFSPQDLFINLLTKQEINLHSGGNELSPREQHILYLLLLGYSTHKIAKKLNISFKTVSAHKLRGLRKLRLCNIIILSLVLNEWSYYLSFNQVNDNLQES